MHSVSDECVCVCVRERDRERERADANECITFDYYRKTLFSRFTYVLLIHCTCTCILHVYVHVVFLTLLVEIILAKFLSLLRNGLYLVCIPGFVSEPSPGDRLRPPPAEEEEA